MKPSLNLILILILFSCTNDKVEPPINPEIVADELPSQESWNSTVFFSDSGKTQAVMYAGHLRVFQQSKETLIDGGLKVEFFNDEEIKTTTLTSLNGRVDEVTNNLFAFDSVVVVNDSGMVVKTDELMWRNTDRQIVSDKFVTIKSPKEFMQGYGFESDQHLQNYIIYNITYITNSNSDR